MLGQVSAIIASIILIGLMVFQFMLILGRPLGHYAWGGQHKVLPTKLRVGSVVAILIYILSIVILLDESGVTSVISNSFLNQYGIWVLCIYFLIGVPLNALSRSKPERNVMTPVVATLCALTFIVALV